MIIVGAGGLSIEVLEIVKETYIEDSIYFFDDVNNYKSKLIFEKFKILTNENQVKEVFKKYGNEYCIGVGGIQNKISLIEKFDNYGGKLCSIVSEKCFIGKENINLGTGCVIFPGVKISNNVNIGKGCLIYYNSIITHDCVIGEYAEISPSVNILGGTQIGERVWLGANATVLPKLKIGDDVVVGAGAVVTKNVDFKKTVIGIPAKDLMK